MKSVLLFFYNIIGAPLLLLAGFLGSLVNSKIRKGLSGRRNMYPMIREQLSATDPTRPRIWFHVSSYGEFLQLKPVLSHLKELNPAIFIIITFFSPSGYDQVAVSALVDLKCYLPFDTYLQAKKFIALISPQVAAIVRHDVWPNFVWRLNREKIPLILIDASIPQSSSRLWLILRGINRHLFSLMEAILAISEEEAVRFRRLVDDPAKIIVVGDTKYDQVFERSQNLTRIAALLENSGLKAKDILVVGSSWQLDEDYLIPAFQRLSQKYKKLAMILAPHEPTPSRLEEIEKRLHQAQLSSVRLSQLTPDQFECRCLIIDQIGLLANIYYLGKVAFVGGSFYYKVHNVLEPAVYGIPVLFGPKMTNSAEAQNLLNRNAAILVDSTQKIVDVITNLFDKPAIADGYGGRAKQVVMQNVGNSRKIARLLLNYF